MPDTIEITIPAEPKYLKIHRPGIKVLSEIAGFTKEESNNITLAVDEACSNVIKHAYNGPTSQPIHIQCHIFDDRIEFIIRDYGKKANVEEIKSRQLDDVRPGGLGVHLINTVMDSVMYDRNVNAGNKLHLIKYLKNKGAPC